MRGFFRTLTRMTLCALLTGGALAAMRSADADAWDKFEWRHPDSITNLPVVSYLPPDNDETVWPASEHEPRPTIPEEEYEHLKDLAWQEGLFPGMKGGIFDSPFVLDTIAPVPDALFQGQQENGWFPPDTHGAIGRDQYVEVVNSQVNVFRVTMTGPPKLLKSVTLNVFLGATRAMPPYPALFDPRVIYDFKRDRWIVMADGFWDKEKSDQRIFIGVSKTPDATGAFNFVTMPDMSVGYKVSGDEKLFFDYPQLGMDNDAIFITGTYFPTGAPPYAAFIDIPKDSFYSGAGAILMLFNRLIPTLAPPIVIDNSNPRSYMMAAQAGTYHVALYSVINSGDPLGILFTGPGFVTVGQYSTPRRAKQPLTANVLDTLDCRFQNASAQNGRSLFNVHTINVSGYPMPRYYELDTEDLEVRQIGTFGSTLTSDDWNPSIIVNPSNDVFVTWSSTDPAAGVFPQIRVSGRLHTDLAGQIGPGFPVINSTGPYASYRWGDYTAFTLDLNNPMSAWGVNEIIAPTGSWTTYIFRAVFPSLDP